MELNKESIQMLLERMGRSIQGNRIRRNLSQKELSQLSGVSVPSIARLETGTGNISLQNLFSILKSLEMADEFFSVFGEPESSPSLLAKATTQKTRSRVRKTRIATSKETWKWGDEHE